MEWQQKLLVNYDALTDAETGIDVKYVTDYLRRDNAVRADEYEEIHLGSNCRVRAERLLELLLEKDVWAYTYFYEALQENYPHFAKLLDDTSLDQCDRISLNAASARKKMGANFHSHGATSYLPTLSSLFMGRETEKLACLRWLQKLDNFQPMYTLIGPPGVGKTALIVNTCHQFIQNLKQPEHCCLLFFDLRSMETVEDLAVDMLFFLQTVPGKSPLNVVCNLIRSFEKDMVLVLDNAEDAMCEKLKGKFLEFLTRILQSNARVRVMLTSRISVKLLSVDICEVKLNPLNENDGCSLAKHLVPSLKPELVTRFCQLTGYLPLGLHLLATLLKGEDKPGELISALEEHPVSTLNAMQAVEGIPSSSQLANCFRTSFDRLDKEQQSCIISCSVFPSSFDRLAAQNVFNPEIITELKTSPLVTTQKILRSLIDRSMLMFDEHSRRYSMHPLLRSFCEAVAKDHPENWQYAEIRSRLCEYYIDFVENINNLFFEKDSCGEAVQQFWSERQNIEHAIQLCLSNRKLTRLLFRFSSRTGVEFLRITLQNKVIRKVYESLLESLEPHELEERSVVLIALGYFFRVEERDVESSLGYVEEANNLQDSENVSDIEKRTFCMHSRAKVYALLGRFDEAETIAKESLKLSINHPEENVRWILQGFSIEALAEVHRCQFKQTRDKQKAEQSIGEYKTLLKYIEKIVGNHIFTRYIYLCQADLQRGIGDFKGALSFLEDALQVQNIVMGNCVDRAQVHRLIGEVQEKLQDDNAALEAFKTSFEVSSQVLGPSPETKSACEKVVEILNRLGDSDKAEWYESRLRKLLGTVQKVE